MLRCLDSWTTLSGGEVNDGRFVMDHFSYNGKKYRVCEINPMIDANISGIKHELKIVVQVPMSDRQPIFASNIVEKCSHFFADQLRKIELCKLVVRQNPNGSDGSTAPCKNLTVCLSPNLFYYLSNTVET